MLLRAFLACLALVALTACDDTRRNMTPPSAQAMSTTMPPARIGACADSALVDEKCTNSWYTCSDDHGTCASKWQECCRATIGK